MRKRWVLIFAVASLIGLQGCSKSTGREKGEGVSKPTKEWVINRVKKETGISNATLVVATEINPSNLTLPDTYKGWWRVIFFNNETGMYKFYLVSPRGVVIENGLLVYNATPVYSKEAVKRLEEFKKKRFLSLFRKSLALTGEFKTVMVLGNGTQTVYYVFPPWANCTKEELKKKLSPYASLGYKIVVKRANEDFLTRVPSYTVPFYQLVIIDKNGNFKFGKVIYCGNHT